MRGSDAPFSVLLPGKPATVSREVELAGLKLNLQMTASEVGSASFLVGATQVADSSKIMAVREAMKQGMVNNIRGTITKETNGLNDDIEAQGSLQNGQPVLMVARFVVKGNWVYQVVALGPEKALTPEVIDTFMTSFKI